MKNRGLFFIVLIIIFINGISSNENYVPGEIIVKYKSDVIVNGNEIITEKEVLIYEYIEKPKVIEKITPNLEIYTLKFENGNIKKLIEEYSELPEVEYAEPNYIMKSFFVPNDENYSLQWGAKNINAEQAWNLTIGNKTAVIAIIDTGVDWDHPDLSNNIWNNSDESCNTSADLDNNGYNGDCRGYDFVNVSSGCSDADCSTEDNDPMDYNGHGTHVSGIAAAVSNNSVGIAGVCWNCSIMPLRAGYQDNSGNGVLELSDVVQALYYATDNNATIISMSFGGSHSATLEEAINYSFGNNSILVAAAGNDGLSSQQYPCAYNKVICVGAINSDNTSASYSNYGSWVDLAAPGTGILSTYYNNSYVSASGTSMSVPFVAGAIGLIKTLFNKNQTEIKNALNNTGNLVNFTSVVISRIDVYSAILSLDNIKPNISLIFPINGHINLTLNQSFSCNASDWQLKNITLQIWNSTNLYYNETKNISGTFNETSFNVSMDYGSYKWNCLVYDSQNNYGYANNFSLFIGNLTVSLISPSNNTNTNSNISFNCSAQTESLKNLTNITFSLWNSTNLYYNETKNISGVFDSEIFNYNFSYENNYYWNCKAFNNNSESAIASNFTIIYDITSSNVSLLSPSDSQSYNSNEQIIFSYNVSDINNIANCSLIINNEIDSTNSSINKSLNNSFIKSFSPGDYSWSVNCRDNSGNIGNSSSRRFSVILPVATVSSSSGGGGTSIKTKTFVISSEQALTGYIKELEKNDEIRFTFFDKETVKHVLTVNEIGKDYVNITIKSTPINFLLGIGQSIKLNLTNPDYYDLYIKLNSIKNNNAEITLQIIQEEIYKPITGKLVETEDKENEKPKNIEKEIEDFSKEVGKLRATVYILVLMIIIILIIIFFKEKSHAKKEKKNKKIKEYKEVFNKHLRPKKTNP